MGITTALSSRKSSSSKSSMAEGKTRPRKKVILGRDSVKSSQQGKKARSRKREDL